MVWQKSYALALAVYQATRAFPRSELFGLTSQLRRASVSVPANIAEGYCRRSRPDYLRFLSISQGSIGEIDTLLSLARDLSYLDAATGQQLAGVVDEIGKMLTRLTQNLRASRSGSLDPSP
jgi:four helix bundle protein